MPDPSAVSAATAPSAGAGQSLPGGAVKAKSTSMSRFILDLIRPYRGWLAIVFAAMVVETAMSLAGPWPIKVIIDNVVGSHPLPHWLSWRTAISRGWLSGQSWSRRDPCKDGRRRPYLRRSWSV